MKDVFGSYKLYKAKVISHDDPEESGGIVIQILPEQKDVTSQSNLPIAVPFFSINSDSQFSNDMPTIGSIIRVLVDSYWKRFYYLGNKIFQQVFDYSTITTKLGEIEEGPDDLYANIKFRMYEDGALEFHNNNSGEHGFIHSNGSYDYYDSSGKRYVTHGSTKITMEDTKILIENATDLEVTGITNLTINATTVEVTGGTFTMDGSVAPTGSGPFCAIPNCLFTGAPHIGKTVTGT